VTWDGVAERAEERYADGRGRLPTPDHPERRQRQLVRMAMAAGAAGLAHLMAGRGPAAVGWLRRSADHYRESWSDAPPGSWGRPVGALKARFLAGDAPGAEEDARWILGLSPERARSAIARYAFVLALLALGRDADAASAARELGSEETFPAPVADALRALAERDAEGYGVALGDVLRSFESRDAYLEDVPVADTVLVLEALAEVRDLEVRPRSRLLP
jgi:hypothetical protein